MGSSSSKPMTSNEFDLLLKKNSTILSMQQKASDSAQASSANTLSITALQNAGDIPTLVTDAIQNNKDVMAAIGDSARKEISGNYVKQTTLDPLIQNVNGNIVIGSSGNGVILGSGSTPLPITAGNITAGNITAGDLAIGTLTATGDLKGKSLHITTNATIEGSLDSLTSECMTCNGNDAYFNGNINMTAATKNRFNYGVGAAEFFIDATGFIGANSIQTADLTVADNVSIGTIPAGMKTGAGKLYVGGDVLMSGLMAADAITGTHVDGSPGNWTYVTGSGFNSGNSPQGHGSVVAGYSHYVTFSST